MKKNTCTMCSKGFQGKGLSFEQKKFCCKKCCDKFKSAKSKKVCEFC